jgi:hypothetical protein
MALKIMLDQVLQAFFASGPNTQSIAPWVWENEVVSNGTQRLLAVVSEMSSGRKAAQGRWRVSVLPDPNSRCHCTLLPSRLSDSAVQEFQASTF